MSALRDAVAEYLAVRRSLGFKLVRTESLLNSFVEFMDAHGGETVTVDLAVAWATNTPTPSPGSWGFRLNTVRVFARYQQAIDPATEVPPTDLLPARGGRATPHLFSVDEIARMMAAASEVVGTRFRAATFATLIGLLAVSGMRLGEALGLDRDEVDLDAAILTVHGKFDRTRHLPLHATTVDALRSYARRRDRRSPTATTFFVTNIGTRLSHQRFYPVFNRIVAQAGITATATKPTPHHLRHSFAVRTLIGWYRDGHDVDARLPLLSTYLGHSNPANTYWYLSAAPELFALVGRRLEATLGELP